MSDIEMFRQLTQWLDDLGLPTILEADGDKRVQGDLSCRDYPYPMLSERMFAPFDIQDLQQRTFAIRLMLGVSRKTGDAFANSG